MKRLAFKACITRKAENDKGFLEYGKMVAWNLQNC